MARLASVVKQGFFPAPPEAIAGILRHLKIPDPPPDSRFKAEDINILDPCAGEARALVQLAEGLGVSPGHVFAVELNARRAATIAETHPEVRLLGPCSFQATRITRQSLSMVYLNPPFDDEFGGGGREEVTFLRQSVDLLVPGGILVLVCPVKQVFGAGPMCELLDTWFESLEVFLFPDACRKFNECVVFGRRRKAALPDAHIHTQGVLTSRDIRYCSAAPIAQLARLGEPQFSKWDFGRPVTESRKTGSRRLGAAVLPGTEAVREDGPDRRGAGVRAGPLAPVRGPASAGPVADQAAPAQPQQGPHEPPAAHGDARRLRPQRPAPRRAGATPARPRSSTAPSATRRPAATPCRSRSSPSPPCPSSGPSGPTAPSAPSATRSATTRCSSTTRNPNRRTTDP